MSVVLNKDQDMAKVWTDWALGTTYEDLPEKVVAEAKNQVLDFFGCAAAGMMKEGPVEVRELNLMNGGKEEATVWGPGTKLPVAYAAQCNATAGHALDFDDVHDAVIHPGVVSMSTSMAMADYLGGISGKDLILNMAIGGELMVRLNQCMHPGKPIPPWGWHTTTLNGNLVAALLASKLMGLDREKTLYAIGLGYHQSSGNGQNTKDGGFAKRIGPGLACRNGIQGAQLASMGLTAAINSLEGEWGLFHTYMFDDYTREPGVADLGERWEAANILCKPYPCCRGNHNHIDAGLYLKKTYDIDAKDIDHIDIKCGVGTLPLLGQPLEVKAHPKSVADVQFSVAWGVSSALTNGQATLKEYSDSEDGIWNEAIRETAAKITSLEYDPECDPANPEVSMYEGSRVTVTMKDGNVYTVYKAQAKGSAEDPNTYDDVLTKYYGNLAYAEKPIIKENGDKIAEICRDLETCDDVRVLNDLMRWA